MLQAMSEHKVIDAKNHVYENYVLKSAMPKQNVMCEQLGIKTTKTFRNHLDYLISRGYIIEEDKRYVLPEMEDIYFYIPLKTLRYLNNNCREHVIKIYVYLGQRFKWAMSRGVNYEFTSEELGDHIGIKVKNNSKGYSIVNNALELLYNSELIDYVSYFDGMMQKKKLTRFSFEYKEMKG